jgi:hypothetical protein
MKRATRLLIALSILAGLTIAVAQVTSSAPAQERTTASDSARLLGGLLNETGWQYVQEQEGIFRVPMEQGPDVWVHASGEYVCTRAIVGELPAPEELTTKPFLDLLMANFALYRGKFGVDQERTVWFEINTPRRLLDKLELDLSIRHVAKAAGKHRITPAKRAP